jgi:hypothetical protein
LELLEDHFGCGPGEALKDLDWLVWPAGNESGSPAHFESLERAGTKFLEFGVEIVRGVFVGPQPATAIGERGMQL